jgi:S1-C subfamily serine protease
VYTILDTGGVLVTRVEEGSSAAAAGVKEGDYLIAVGDISVADEQFGEHFRAKFGTAAEGSPLVVKVRRGAQTVSLTGKLRFAAGDIILGADPKASAKAIRIRSSILKG